MQAQFDLAKEAVAKQAVASSAGAVSGHSPAAAATAGAGASSRPPDQGPPADPRSPSVAISRAQALAHLQSLPDGLKNCAITLLGQQQFDLQRMQQDIRVALQAKWGEQLPAIWEQLASYFRRPGPNPVKLPSATAAETVVRNSPTSPLELDQAMLRYGEPSQRLESRTPPWMQVDSMGFLDGLTAPQGTNMVSRARRSEHHKFASAELPQIRTRHNTLRQRQ